MASPIQHGTSTGYKRGCRCADCRAAVAAYMRRRRASRRAYVEKNGLPEGIPHGTVNAYTNWSCRCDDCTRAVVAYNRARLGGKR